MAYFSHLEPIIYFNEYGFYDYLLNKFYEQSELIFYSNKTKEKS